MIDITLSILALVAGGVSLELFATTKAAAAGRRITFKSEALNLDESAVGNPS
jgi:hypothetical protein